MDTSQVIYLPPIQLEQPPESTSPYRPRVPLKGQKSKISVSLIKQNGSIKDSDSGMMMNEQDDGDSENNFNLEVKAIM